MIELRDVSYFYENRPALRGVTLSVARGEAVALVGPNGCGKSTLLRLLNGLLDPASGSYVFGGEQITRKKLRDRAFAKTFHARIGFVFQNSDAQLFCPTVFDEIAFAPRAMGLPEDEVERRVNDLLGLLGLEGFEDRAPYQLSGGEKRKTAIAAEFAKNPDALALDEWADGLDPRTERRVREFLLSLAGAGKTLVTATHDLGLARAAASRVVVLGEDHAVAADGPSELLLRDMDLLRKVNLI